jgi:hypothetical protein
MDPYRRARRKVWCLCGGVVALVVYVSIRENPPPIVEVVLIGLTLYVAFFAVIAATGKATQPEASL